MTAALLLFSGGKSNLFSARPLKHAILPRARFLLNIYISSTQAMVVCTAKGGLISDFFFSVWLNHQKKCAKSQQSASFLQVDSAQDYNLVFEKK